VVHILVARLRLPVAPFVFACTFVADAASFVLPVSNPVNLIILGATGAPLGQFARLLLLPSAVVLAWNLGFFLAFFRSSLGGTIDPSLLPELSTDTGYRRAVTAALGAIAFGYLGATTFGISVPVVSLTGAALLTATAAAFGRLHPGRTLRAVSWPLFPFVGGMVLVVQGVDRLGLSAFVADRLLELSGGSTLGSVVVIVMGVALGANLINNVPMALVAASALGRLAPEANNVVLHHAAVLGADLGPNISVVGSLATMLWLLMLRRRGLAISSLDYLRFGILVTPPALLLGALALWSVS
jgi:arsenical pump membrane protein